jgi:excisionase family DNA binding protein
VSALAQALLAELDDATLDALADALAPRIANRLAVRNTGDAWLRGASSIAGYIGCPVSRVYALTSAGRIPVERDGSALVARRSDLDGWLRAGGAKRP